MDKTYTAQDEYDFLMYIWPLMQRVKCGLTSCGRIAIMLDHNWPYEIRENRCEKHARGIVVIKTTGMTAVRCSNCGKHPARCKCKAQSIKQE